MKFLTTPAAAVKEQNIHFLRRAEWNDERRIWIRDYFDDSIQPLIGLDLAPVPTTGE